MKKFGTLKRITDSTIEVRCQVIREDTKNKNSICEQCYWHTHIDRGSKLLKCDCRS